ncbi:MAG: thiamine pyrophosphate-binding protein [Gammaproteobacteria bacterium]|nr:thiamine pyrophosphate-binding protein [Gammaproteobacteria bacterium]
MTKMTGGQAVVEVLRAEDTTHIFGLIGSAAMEIFDALYDADDIQFVGVHDERTGTHMADGFARASGKPGVVLAGQNGPGATNLVTGLAQAKAAFSPVISIAGALSTEHVYRDAFQEVDQDALFKPITKKTWTVTDTARIPEIMRHAFRVAMAHPQGPVLVNLPRNVLSGSADYPPIQEARNYRAYSVPEASSSDITRAFELLESASRPVIIAGGGIKTTRRFKEIVELAHLLQAPIVSSPGHGDAIPFDEKLYAGQMGPRGNQVASGLTRNADVILALGTRLGFNSTFYGYSDLNQNAKIIQVELDQQAIGRFFPVELGIWADAPTVATQLVKFAKERDKHIESGNWCEEFLTGRNIYLRERNEQADMHANPIQPAALFRLLRDILPQDVVYTMDAGTLCLQATDALNYWQSPSLITPLDFGLVGFSFACGLGVKLALPERTVISLMGDGGFGMTVSELSTAVDHKINTTTLVMNNQCWGAEKAYQRDFFNERYIGADVSSPPFDKLAELYGAQGLRAQTIDEVKDTLQSALNTEGPSIIDVAVDPEALYSFRRDSFKHRGG